MNSLSMKSKLIFSHISPLFAFKGRLKFPFKPYMPIKFHKRKFGLMSRIVILTFLISILPIILLLSTIIYDSKMTIKNEIQDSALIFNKNMIDELKETLEIESNILTVLSTDSLFFDFQNTPKEQRLIQQKLQAASLAKEYVSGVYIRLENNETPFSFSKDNA